MTLDTMTETPLDDCSESHFEIISSDGGLISEDAFLKCLIR